MVIVVFVILHKAVGERPDNGCGDEQDNHDQASGIAKASNPVVIITRSAFLFHTVSAFSSGVKRVDAFFGGRHIFYAFSITDQRKYEKIKI
jgi:hypothetical protein